MGRKVRAVDMLTHCQCGFKHDTKNPHTHSKEHEAMKSKATVRPWTLHGLDIGSSKGRVCAVPDTATHNKETKHANAELIVRAVNSYDSNIAELKSLKHSFDSLVNALEDLVTISEHNGDLAGSIEVKNAEKALKLAQTGDK